MEQNGPEKSTVEKGRILRLLLELPDLSRPETKPLFSLTTYEPINFPWDISQCDLCFYLKESQMTREVKRVGSKILELGI